MSGNCPALVVGATQSGTGKTSVALALVRALVRRGLRVQAYKVGPDFLDPTYLAIASQRPCYNLDGWMMGESYVRQLFARSSADADIAVVEGVMGLFDGASATTREGSTAEIAAWLGAPVLLVVNAHGLSRSIAAVVKGFCELEPGVRIGGVLANHCGSPRHAQWLREALAGAALPPLAGAIPRGAFAQLPSRHLGLVTADAAGLSLQTLDQLADVFEQSVDVPALVGLAGSARRPGPPATAAARGRPRVRLGVARDAAFHFYYPDNLEALAAAGCELVEFSPLRDHALPEGLAAVYLGGGYPEVQAGALAENTPLLASLRQFAEQGGAIYAECGGLMYLGAEIETTEQVRHKLAGILPVSTRMLPKRKALGYVEVTTAADSLWGRAGAVLRGHEFHYSELVAAMDASDWRPAYSLRYRNRPDAVPEGFLRDRILASYVHAHFAGRPELVEAFVTFCEGAACARL